MVGILGGIGEDMEHAQRLSFGYFLVPEVERYDEIIENARILDALGFSFIGVQDHPYQRRFLDTWTLLTAIAVQTEHIHVLPDVANLPLRPPAMLAKATASLDVMSEGRAELGLGTGAFWDAIHAMGGPVRTGPEAVSALEEAIAILRLIWSGKRGLQYDGEYYQLAGMHGGPVPHHQVELWIGAYGPRMLRLTGRAGDGWIPSTGYVALQDLRPMNERIDEAAQRAGREPATIRRAINIMGRITDRPGDGDFEGPPQKWVEQITNLALNAGMGTFLVSFSGDEQAQIRQFAEEVVPAVRDAVAASRTP